MGYHLLLKDKNILIMGVRNRRSIAWGIATAAAREGANLIFTCLGEREKQETEELVAPLGNFPVYQCDISSDDEIKNCFEVIRKDYGVLHGVVHAIANAKTEDLQRDYVYTSREGFAHALDVSAYSLVAVCREAKELMTEGGSVITLTYAGSERVVRGYNVMGVAKAALEASVRYLANDLGEYGIQVNAISAGPIKTVSAKGVKSLSNIKEVVEEKAPLHRGITLEDLGNNAVYLLSHLSSGVTGEIIYVDCGFNIIGI
ncbi:MAG TPA: enoyl-ACP reductase [Bacillota bacterium]|nr:enoyl-ACP reductase [Bacillota bacterium]